MDIKFKNFHIFRDMFCTLANILQQDKQDTELKKPHKSLFK